MMQNGSASDDWLAGVPMDPAAAVDPMALLEVIDTARAERDRLREFARWVIEHKTSNDGFLDAVVKRAERALAPATLVPIAEVTEDQFETPTATGGNADNGWRDRPTITIEEAAAVLGIGRSTAYVLTRTGELPTLKLGRRHLVPTARLRVMLGEVGR